MARDDRNHHGFERLVRNRLLHFTSLQKGQGFGTYVGSHIRPRVRIPPKWHWPVGVSLSNEIGCRAAATPRIPGPGKFVPSLISSSAAGTLSSTPLWTDSFHGPGVKQGVVSLPTSNSVTISPRKSPVHRILRLPWARHWFRSHQPTAAPRYSLPSILNLSPKWTKSISA